MRVGDGPSDGNARVHILDAAGRGPDRGLGRPVHVVDLAFEDLAQMMDERRGNGLAAEQHLFERAQRGEGARIERQHARQRRRHLQMRDAVARDLIGDGCRAFVAVDDDGKAARERPEQLEHRNIKRHAGDGQPHAWLAADGAIHAGEEIHHVAVLDHHAFRLARGAGGVHDVGDVRGRGGGGDGLRALAREAGSSSVENGETCRQRRKMRARCGGGEQHRHLRNLQSPAKGGPEDTWDREERTRRRLSEFRAG